MGCILIVIGVILFIARDYSAPLVGIIVIGIVLAVIGFLWKPRKNSDSIPKDTD